MNLPKLARFILLAIFFFPWVPSPKVAAQSDEVTWGQLVSLTNSGAASRPQLVASPDGTAQVFWWDQFDGLKTSYQASASADDPNAGWNTPQKRPLVSLQLETAPVILIDGLDQVHALWLEMDEGLKVLIHSYMSLTGESWSTPSQVAVTVAGFNAIASPSGGLTLAYLQNGSSESSPAGVYLSQFTSGGWSGPHLVSASEYYRSLTEEQGWVRVWDAGNGQIYLTWEDRRLGLALYSSSQDNGSTWSPPEALGQATDRPFAPRVVTTPNGTIMRSWQISLADGCGMYQQTFGPSGDTNQVPEWSSPTRILTDLPSCPSFDRYWTVGNELFWLWGEGTNNLALVAWNSAQLQWSQPVNIRFQYEDARIGRQTDLREMTAWIDGNRVIVSGVDSRSSDVWVTSASFTDFQWFYTTASAWMDPFFESYADMQFKNISLAADLQDQTHMVWTEGLGNLSILYYSKWDGSSITNPTQILREGEGEILRQPALYVDAKDVLHLVWSGGPTGSLYHSSVATREAAVPLAWSEPIELTKSGVASWPQIGADAAGNLYILYTVSLNEGRGLYLLRSEDFGKDWSEPRQVVDGAASGSQMLDHPTMVVHTDGSIHVAWVDASLPGTWLTRDILYSSSYDGGTTWTAPQSLAGEGFDWPKIAFARNQIHLVFADADGNIWHRWAPADVLTPGSVAWSPVYNIPDWREVQLPFALSVDGSGPSAALYLVGVGSDGTRLLFSTWEDFRWTDLEIYYARERWAQSHGVAALANPKGGSLVAAWPVQIDREGKTEVGLYLASRAVPTADLSAVQAAQGGAVTSPSASTAAPGEVTATSPETIMAATRTPIPINPSFAGSNSQSSPIPSIAMSGGLAAVVFAVGLMIRSIWNKRKS